MRSRHRGHLSPTRLGYENNYYISNRYIETRKYFACCRRGSRISHSGPLNTQEPSPRYMIKYSYRLRERRLWKEMEV